jgi:hypothetical protein
VLPSYHRFQYNILWFNGANFGWRRIAISKLRMIGFLNNSRGTFRSFQSTWNFHSLWNLWLHFQLLRQYVFWFLSLKLRRESRPPLSAENFMVLMCFGWNSLSSCLKFRHRVLYYLLRLKSQYFFPPFFCYFFFSEIIKKFDFLVWKFYLLYGIAIKAT